MYRLSVNCQSGILHGALLDLFEQDSIMFRGDLSLKIRIGLKIGNGVN